MLEIHTYIKSKTIAILNHSGRVSYLEAKFDLFLVSRITSDIVKWSSLYDSRAPKLEVCKLFFRNGSDQIVKILSSQRYLHGLLILLIERKKA